MQSPYLTTNETATFLRFEQDDGRPDLAALAKFLARYRGAIVTVKRGKTVLVDRDSLILFLHRQDPAFNKEAFAAARARINRMRLGRE